MSPATIAAPTSKFMNHLSGTFLLVDDSRLAAVTTLDGRLLVAVLESCVHFPESFCNFGAPNATKPSQVTGP